QRARTGPGEERRPGLAAQNRDEAPAIALWKGWVGPEMGRAAAITRQRLACLVEDGQPGQVREEDAVEERDVHALPLAGATAADQRHEDALRGEETADGVDHRRPAQDRPAVRLARPRHEAAHPPPA